MEKKHIQMFKNEIKLLGFWRNPETHSKSYSQFLYDAQSAPFSFNPIGLYYGLTKNNELLDYYKLAVFSNYYTL